MEELLAGEEMRCNPDALQFSAWLRKDVLSLPRDGSARFPASFDRSVWLRPEDLDEPSARPVSRTIGEARNILELVPIKICEEARDNPSGIKDWRIAVTLVTFRGSLSQAFRRARETEAAAAAWGRPQGWMHTGYDVLDSGLAMSGLFNFGSPAVALARRVLGEHRVKLTQFYLWPSSEAAAEFAIQLDAVIPDHAPFEVVGMYVCSRW